MGPINRQSTIDDRQSTAGAVRLGWVAFFVAVGVLGFEISLMRVLLLASWHHFAFLVISVALLGFGASGTALFMFRSWIEPRREAVLFALVLVTAVSMPICAGLAQHVPVEARIVPALIWRQLGLWALYWMLLGIPFLTGAGAIGLSLMTARQSAPGVYAANLLGSAAGAALATAAMSFLPPEWLSTLMGGVVLVGAVPAGPRGGPFGLGGRGAYPSRSGASPVGKRSHTRGSDRRHIHMSGKARRTYFAPRRAAVWVGCIATVLVFLWFDPPKVGLDPYKYGAYVHRLEKQGLARKAAEAYGPRGFVEAYSGDVFHELPFLSGGAAPPPVTVLVADGHLVGSVLDVSAPEDASVVDQMVMAFPYSLAPPNPRVALLGETGGVNVWLAARNEAASIHVVQPDANVLTLIKSELADYGGSVLKLPGVETIAAEPRHFVEHAPMPFDLIQLVSLESSSAGLGGVGGLGQDHLLTVEGIGACLDRLSPDGLLTVTRGIVTPPRDNLRLLATFVDALRISGIGEPDRHIVIVRDYLAVCTIAQASPFSPGQIQRVRRECAERQLTPVWFSGVRAEELNQPDSLAGPQGTGDLRPAGDWYHYAATQLFSDGAERFIDQWPFDIRPPTDQRPFFHDFCKIGAIGELKRTFGDLWLTRAELGFLFVLAAIVVVAVVGGALTLLPLVFMRKARGLLGWGPTMGYFAAIGAGYLVLEITFLSRLTRWIGDPITAAAVTISGFLLFSGLGSLTVQRLVGGSATGRLGGRLIRRVVLGLVAIGVVELLVFGLLGEVVGFQPYPLRCAAAMLAIAPLGYLMGFLMPAGLAQLDRGERSLIAWAWGVNGFASVLAAPLATAIGMTWGFHVAGALALTFYVVPAVLFARLPGRVGRASPDSEWRVATGE